MKGTNDAIRTVVAAYSEQARADYEAAPYANHPYLALQLLAASVGGVDPTRGTMRDGKIFYDRYIPKNPRTRDLRLEWARADKSATLTSNIRKIAKARGHQFPEGFLATATETHSSTVLRWMRPYRPSVPHFKTLERLAEVLECELDDLYTVVT